MKILTKEDQNQSLRLHFDSQGPSCSIKTKDLNHSRNCSLNVTSEGVYWWSFYKEKDVLLRGPG